MSLIEWRLRTVMPLNQEATSLAGPMRAPYIPKIKIYAEVVLTDGRILNGYAFLEATTRLQDLLNNSSLFFPFLDDDQNVHLLNKTAVVSVRPIEG